MKYYLQTMQLKMILATLVVKYIFSERGIFDIVDVLA